MKVLIGQFKTESNANVNLKNEINAYDLGFGEDCLRKSEVKEVFEQERIEMIPSIYADTGPSYVLSKATFDYIEGQFLRTVKEHLHEIDGIYMLLHGASYVEGIGSGDFHILHEIRKITGPYLPIFIACDPHGNLCDSYVKECTYLRSYRESPHTDAKQTKQKVARELCHFLKNRERITPVYRKLPLILGGEQSVSSDEPVKTINQFLNQMESDERILSCSWHVGYLRHDCPEAGCGVVVVPAKERDQAYANEVADKIKQFIWERRHEFHYTGLTLQLEEAVQKAISFSGKPVFLTDSGDNTGSGAPGWNTILLRYFLEHGCHGKKVLFANITDSKSYSLLNDHKNGDVCSLLFGANQDEYSLPVELNVQVKASGDLKGCMMHDRSATFGHSVLVSLTNETIDINVADTNWGMCEEHQFTSAGMNWDDYDILVVKQGYIQPECKDKAALSIMVLTEGTTLQDTKSIQFKQIQRPMYPVDEI